MPEHEFHSFTVSAEESGERIDKFLGGKLTGLVSRSRIKKFIIQGKIKLNSLPVDDPNQKLHDQDRIEVEVVPDQLESPVLAADIPLEIVYDDEYLLCVNKPAGMVVHPAAGHSTDTLVNALLFLNLRLSGVGGLKKPGIVHRLDRETSGLLLVAKDDRTHMLLSQKFKEHEVRKMYVALVRGAVAFDEGVVEAAIGRDSHNRKKMSVVSEGGKPAFTRYRVRKRGDSFSVLEAFPESGRTHQIRVHMAHLGYPVLGDSLYNRHYRQDPINRQALHAQKLSFEHPCLDKRVELEVEPPEDMRKLMAPYG